MNPGRFYIPRYMGIGNRTMISPMMSFRNNAITSPIMNLANSAPRGMGLFSRITSGIRSFNWSGILNGANKTLNVFNQAIPLVRQAGPMVNNMKSMLRIARAFGSETTINPSNRNRNNNLTINNINNTDIDNLYNNNNLTEKKEVSDDNYPNFFV